MALPVSSSTTGKLRETYVTIEKHLRSLKALGENDDQAHFVLFFFFKSKLPKIVMARMEEYKDMAGEMDRGKHLQSIQTVYLRSRSWGPTS